MNININTFNDWAIKDKDIAMQKGHESAVEYMFELIDQKTDILNRPFSFLDIGCGNGWVVRKVSKIKNCNLAEGIDGAEEMIEKAKRNDENNNYYLNDIESWTPNKKYDIIFSMEVFYYFNNPGEIISRLSRFIKEGGIFIIGIDHYAENIPSLDWGEKFNLDIITLSIENWITLFESAGFNNIEYKQVEKQNDWQGTLIITAYKNL